jgi:hypothetical protein
VTTSRRPDDVRRWAAELARGARHEAPADVLAGVAAAVGTGWDGPGRPVAVEVPAAPGWVVLDAAREALLDGDRRRHLGAHHTPSDLAGRLVALALAGLGADALVADPACGGGAFLVAAAEALVAAGADPVRVVSRQLIGIDLDPLAVATSRAAIGCWAADHGVVADPEVRLGDGLAEDWQADAVVGNPPFLSPLGATTAGGHAAVSLRRALGGAYTDTAGLFLVRAMQQVRPGGRIVLVQPESLLSARDARPVREAAGPRLEGLWVAGEPVFAASVRVCAPVVRAEVVDGPVRRWRGRAVMPAPRAARPAGDTWASMRPTSAPRVRVGAGPVLGDIAAATAGFRDQFYGLAAVVVDGGSGHPLVTSGLLDAGRCAWGERAARIAGRRFERPTVEPSQLAEPLRSWVTARLVPKVLVATQTRVVEAAADPDGRLVPLTPVVAVVPHDPALVWRVAAALTSPAVSAWALTTHGGAALSGDAIKLSARQVLAAPLPGDAGAWDEAADALRRGDVPACGAALAGGDDRLLRWWLDRLPASRTV